jgi:hypothetical protein
MPVISIRAAVLGFAAVLSLAACASHEEKIQKHEDLLSASGFSIRPADTAERQALIDRLPARRFVERTHDGKPVFLYADNEVCHCLYVGDDKAYSTFQSTITQRQMARDAMGDQAQLRNESIDDYHYDVRLIEDRESAWDWGPWY